MNTDLNCVHSFGISIYLSIYLYLYIDIDIDIDIDIERVLLHLNKQTKIMSQIVPDKRRMGDCRGRSELNFQIADKSTKSFKT